MGFSNSDRHLDCYIISCSRILDLINRSVLKIHFELLIIVFATFHLLSDFIKYRKMNNIFNKLYQFLKKTIYTWFYLFINKLQDFLVNFKNRISIFTFNKLKNRVFVISNSWSYKKDIFMNLINFTILNIN